MKIAKIESLHADAGPRNFDFLKITTDDGLVGPTTPGWGTEINEEAVRAHPPRKR